MLLIDGLSLIFITLTLVAAVVAGRFTRAGLTVAAAVILPAGLVGTLIGVVLLLNSMDNPSMIGPGIGVALLPAFYSALTKWGLALYQPNEPPVPESALVYRGSAAALFLVFPAVLLVPDPLVFVDYRAGLAVGLGAGLILAVAGRRDRTHGVAALVQSLPAVGLLAVFASLIVILHVLDDPSAFGPAMSFGLMSLLYANGLVVSVTLMCPALARPTPRLSQWVSWGGALLGIVMQLSVLFFAFSTFD